jgi:hypothetical protein
LLLTKKKKNHFAAGFSISPTLSIYVSTRREPEESKAIVKRSESYKDLPGRCDDESVRENEREIPVAIIVAFVVVVLLEAN